MIWVELGRINERSDVFFHNSSSKNLSKHRTEY